MALLRHFTPRFPPKSRQILALNVRRIMSTDPTEDSSPAATQLQQQQGGYAKAFTKFETIKDAKEQELPQNFTSLLRHSKFMDLGDPEGKVVTGKIFHVVEDDLYIDFGWKFHCVCPRPKRNASDYIRGAKVRLLVKDLELSSKFLGYEKDLTLLEADCVLLGLQQDRSGNVSRREPKQEQQ